jgi:hypothetical protein
MGTLRGPVGVEGKDVGGSRQWHSSARSHGHHACPVAHLAQCASPIVAEVATQSRTPSLGQPAHAVLPSQPDDDVGKSFGGEDTIAMMDKVGASDTIAITSVSAVTGGAVPPPASHTGI